MKKSSEIRNEINEKIIKAQAMLAEGKYKDTKEMLEEIKNLKTTLYLAEEEEELNRENANDGKAKEAHGKGGKDFVMKQRKEFNGLLTGRISEAQMSLNEKSGEDGGYLVPEDQTTEIYEFKRELLSLKPFCTVYSTNSVKGKLPIEVEAKDALYDFDDDGTAQLTEKSIKFGQVSYECYTKGDLIPISNSLLEDETAKLSQYIGRRFAKKAVRAENTDILEVLATASDFTPIKDDYHDIISALNKGIPSAVKVGAMILTNQDGYAYLDSLEDKNGRPLLRDLPDGSGIVFKGKKVVAMDNDDIVASEGKLKFYIGNIAEFVAFIDRKGIEVATSEHAAFTRNAILMRAIERYCTKAIDNKAVVSLEITNPTA